MKKYFLIFLIIIFITTIFSGFTRAQEKVNVPRAPETIDEAKTMGTKILKGFPETLKGIWRGAFEVWRNIFERAKSFCSSHIKPWIINIWNKIKILLGKEVEKRKPEVEKEFKKETKEMKEEVKREAPKIGKNMWKRFQELIQWWKD